MLGWDTVQSEAAAVPSAATPLFNGWGGAVAADTTKRFIVQLDNGSLRDAGAVALLAKSLRPLGNRFAIVSSNSRDTARTYTAKLRRAGLDVPETRVFLAGEQTVRMVGAIHPHAPCLFSASRILTHAARGAGLLPVQRNAEVVMIGRDTAWSYQRLELIANEVARGAALYATNREFAVRATDGRLSPDTGSMVAAVEAVTSVRAELLIGDPPVELFRLAAEALDVELADVVMLESTMVSAPSARLALPEEPLVQRIHPGWPDQTNLVRAWPIAAE